MGKFIEGLMAAVAFPLIMLQWVSWLICAIWILCIGDWRVGGAANFFCVMFCALGYLFVAILLICGVELSLLTTICILAGFLIVSIPVSVLEVVALTNNLKT